MNYGPRQIAQARLTPEIERVHMEANAHFTQLLRRDFPDHRDHFHIMHRGITYEFVSHRSVLGTPLGNRSADMSARIVRDIIDEWDEDTENQHFQFHLRNGDLAVRTEIFRLDEPEGLQDLPAATRLYRRLYYYSSDQPIHATVTVITQSPLQILDINNGPVY